MTKKPKTDSYKKLIRLMVILLVLVILFGTGYVLLNRYSENELNRLKAETDATNQELILQHNEAVTEYNNSLQTGENVSWPSPAAQGWDILDVSTFPLTTSRDVTVSRADLLKGGMMLLNRWHELPSDFPENDIVPVYTVDKTIPVSGASVKLFPVAISALTEMLTSAKADGLENFLIEEGYRTMAKQTEYYDEIASKLTDKYSGEALIAQVIKSGTNYPGTSEYQSGFSFKISRWRKNDTEFNSYKFQTTEHSDWLVEHSWEYGFVFRFPVTGYPNDTVIDKSFKTGEAKKLMIYRYVGKENAAVMHTLNYCMEEYIEYLIAHPHIAVYQDGVLKYEIMRVSGGNTTMDETVQITQTAVNYSISTDNMGGIIIAMSY